MGKSTPGVRLTPLFSLFFIGLVTLFSTTVYANNLPPHTVTGLIKDSKNEPLSGVSILVKGTTNGTTTNADGRFTLTDVADNGTLVISFTGYASQEIAVKGKTEFLVSMELTTLNLDEVVVTGYGTRAKKDVTGAISQIKVTQLENENPPSVQDALRGNTPGLVVTSSPTAKGGGNLQIRGRASISGVSSPLIVLDGVIYQGDLSDINPNDIATIDILKDASSAAVFGAKAASGVILVTTKKGTGNKPTIGFNANVGLATLAMDEPLYDGPGFVNWRSNVLKSQNLTLLTTKPNMFDDPRTLPSSVTVAQWLLYDQPNTNGDPIDIWLTRLKLLPIERENYKKNKQTNWYDMMFQTGLRNDHTVSISGKKSDVSYYMSANMNRM